MNHIITTISRTKLIIPNFKARSEDIPKESELLAYARKGDIALNNIDKKTGETLLQMIVKNDYKNLVSYLTAKPVVRQNSLNYAPNGKTPLDYATTDDMKKILISRGAVHFSDLQKTESASVQNTGAEDAKVVAAKIYMENPVKSTISTANVSKKQEEVSVANQNEIESKQTSAKEQKIQKPIVVDYFDSFIEVELPEEKTVEQEIESKPEIKAKEEADVKSEELKKDGASQIENSSALEKKEEVLKIPESYKNYSVLKITDNDSKSLDDIIGMDKIKNELKENIIIPLNEQSAKATLMANKIDIPNGVFIETSEDITGMVKALAQETQMPVIQLFNPQEITAILNDVENEYKNSNKKTIIFIQGFDKFFTTGVSCDLEKKNFLLTVGNCREKGALLIATADEKCGIDSKFFSPEIFDKVLDLDTPDINNRKEYLRQYFAEKYLFSELNNEDMINELASKTEKFKYADLLAVLEEAARTTVSKQGVKVTPETIRQELAEYTEQSGLLPIDEFNRTAMYDTPDFKRVPVTANEIMSLDQLGGMPEIKEKLRSLYVRPLQKLDELVAEIGDDAIPDGAIFYGPAGNGKTFTAKVLARELGLPFYETKLSDFGTALVHEEPKAFKKLAKQLNDKFIATGERSVWFLDEFDSIGSERSDSDHQHNKELTDTLLQELSNPASRGFILIAATNDLANVDSALKRRGRLGNWIEFKSPDLDGRSDVIRKNLKSTRLTKDLCDNEELIEKISKDLDGLSMASITSILGDAKRIAILNNKNFTDCITLAIDEHMKREMGEFCDKAGLKVHRYNEWDFKTLDELGGMSEVKKQLEENIIDVWDPQIRAMLIANRRSLPGGVILEGPAGTGKTTIIETLARQMNIPLYKMNYQQKGNEYIHGVARNVTDIFERLKLEAKITKKPVMLFFDEAEKFFPRYAQGHQVEEVNTYKDLMNTAAASGIILTAATNRIDLVNQEITGNPRRMGTVIHVGNPDEGDRKNLFIKLLGSLPILSGVLNDSHFQKLAELSEGFSIGNISDTIDKIITQAIKKKQNIDSSMLIREFEAKAKVIPI